MAEYKLVVIIPNSGNKKVFHSIELRGSHESYPEDYFRNEKNRDALRKALAEKSSREVSDAHLNQIVADLVRDIKSGYQPTTLTLNLPGGSGSASSQVSAQTVSSSNSTTPTSSQSTSASGTKRKVPLANSTKWEAASKSTNPTPPENITQESKPDSPNIRSDSNQADF
ncbi:hypothetical protein QUB00_26905 [Microcoleus sp. F8_C2]